MSDNATTAQTGTSAATSTRSTEGDGPVPDADLGGTISMRKMSLGLLLVLSVVGLALLFAFFAAVRHWLALHTGILNGGPDRYYNFWSGFGSDLGEATLISAVGIGVYTGVRRSIVIPKDVGELAITR